METFLQQFGSKIKGVLTGFDRIVFKGCFRHLAYVEGAAKFLARCGVMSVRLQTWFPYEIQVALNGREWLRRGLERRGVAHTVDGNKFLSVGDFGAAQELLDAQPLAPWFGILDGFAREAFPTMGRALGGGPGYYWTLWQSEWATDLILDSPGAVAPLMDSLLRHELANGTGERVLRYFGRPVRPGGQPHPAADPEILSRAGVLVRRGAREALA